MQKIINLLIVMLVPAFSASSMGQAASMDEPVTMSPLLKQAITVSGDQDVVLIQVDVKPGATIPKHFHPGHVFGYLMEGEQTIEYDDMESVTLKPEDTFYTIPNRHMIMSGENSLQTGKMLVLMILPKGQPPIVPVGNQPPPHDEKSVTMTPVLNQAITMSGDQEVVMIMVDMKPGAIIPKHYHPGHVFGYVLEGTMTLEYDDKAPLTLKAGETFYEIPNQNMIMSEKSSLQTGKMLVMMILPKGQPPLVPVQ